jgi:hypothetical protein
MGEEILVHDGKNINLTMSETHIELIIQPSSRKYHGEFTLTLKNSLGMAVGNAKVTVLAPPSMPQGKRTLCWMATSSVYIICVSKNFLFKVDLLCFHHRYNHFLKPLYLCALLNGLKKLNFPELSN